MQDAAWIALLRRVPCQHHDNLVVVTSAGIEIALQSLIRLEEDFMAVRGRLAGSVDTGRIFFIPYSQIVYIGLQKPMAEAEVQSLFGGPPLDAFVVETTPPLTSEPTEPSTSDAGDSSPTAETPAEQASPKETAPADAPLPQVPSKSELLKRLRERKSVRSSGSLAHES